jgi:putative membrane protein
MQPGSDPQPPRYPAPQYPPPPPPPGQYPSPPSPQYPSPQYPVPGQYPPPQPTGVPDTRFHRLHPLTPLVSGARIIGVLAVVVIGGLARNSSTTQPSGDVGPQVIFYGIFAFVVVVAGIVSWVVTRYRVEQGEIRVDSGLLRRQSKRLRLDRLQSVDVVRPLVARIFGLAELRLTTGGTEHTSVRLRYLPVEQALGLRAELLGRAAGLGPGVAEAPEQPLVVVSPGTLVGSTLLDLASGRGLVILVTLGLLSVTTWLSAPAGHKSESYLGLGIAAVLSFVFLIGSDVWRRLNSQWQFTVADSPDGLRLRSGLLSTKSQTVPPGRVQALRIHQPFLWRPFGWAAVHMNVAGVVGRSQSSSRVLLPVAPIGVARDLVEHVLGGVRINSVQVTRPPRRAAFCSPIWWRKMAAGSDASIFVSLHGLFARVIDVVPNVKTQSVRLKTGPWQKLWGLTTLHLDSTRGPVRIKAAHRDVLEGRSMLDTQAERARQARRSASPDRWMTTSVTR